MYSIKKYFVDVAVEMVRLLTRKNINYDKNIRPLINKYIDFSEYRMNAITLAFSHDVKLKVLGNSILAISDMFLKAYAEIRKKLGMTGLPLVPITEYIAGFDFTGNMIFICDKDLDIVSVIDLRK